MHAKLRAGYLAGDAADALSPAREGKIPGSPANPVVFAEVEDSSALKRLRGLLSGIAGKLVKLIIISVQ